MRCGLADRHIAPAADRPRRWAREPTQQPSVPLDRRSRAPLTAFASRLAWVYTPAVRAAVDRFYFSALASVRRAIASTHTPRCVRTSGRLLLLLHRLPCSIHRRTPAHPSDTLCRTGRKSENSAIPSLSRATPSAASEYLVELLGSSPIPRSFVASCVSFQLRPLPSTGITRLRRYYEPLRHPSQPGLSLASCQLIPTAITAGTSRVAHDPLCVHAVANTPAGRMELVRSYNSIRFGLPTKPGRVGSCVTIFGACLAFTHVTAYPLAKSPSDPLQQRLQQSRCLHCCSDCYRVERTSSRAGLTPAVDQRLFTARRIIPFVLIRLTPQAPRDSVGRDAPGVSSVIARV